MKKVLFIMALVVFFFNNSWGQFTAPFAKTLSSDAPDASQVFTEQKTTKEELRQELNTLNNNLKNAKQSLDNKNYTFKNSQEHSEIYESVPYFKNRYVYENYEKNLKSDIEKISTEIKSIESSIEAKEEELKNTIETEKKLASLTMDTTEVLAKEILGLDFDSKVNARAACTYREQCSDSIYKYAARRKYLEGRDTKYALWDTSVSFEDWKKDLIKKIKDNEDIAVTSGRNSNVERTKDSLTQSLKSDSIVYRQFLEYGKTNKEYWQNMNVLNNELNSIENIIHKFKWARDFYDAVNHLDKSPIIKARFAPARSVIAARRFFYDKTDNRKNLVFINNSAIQSNLKDNHKISTEVVSGIFPLFYKKIPLKFSLGTTVDQNNTDNEEEKVASKILSGGLLRPSFTYPLFFSNKEYTGNSTVQIYMPLEIATNIDGVTTDTQTINSLFNFTEISAALNLSFVLSQSNMNENLASIFINGRISYIDGGSVFYDDMPGNRHGFWVSQINFGLKIKNKYTIAFNIPAWSSNKELLKDQKGTIALIID